MDKEILGKIYKKEVGRWAVSILLTLILFVIAGSFSERVFFINDDENMLYTFAGYYTNGQPFEHNFVNYVLGGFFRLMYTLIPSLPWYGIYHVVILYLAVMIINKTILKVGWKKQLSIWNSILICIGVYFIVLVYPTLLMQFTTTATYAGAAAVALILGEDWEKDSKATKIIDGALSILLMLLCYMHRYNTGYVLFCFYAGTILYQYCKLFFPGKTNTAKRQVINLFVQVLILVLMLASVITISTIKRNTDGWEYFRAYDSARFKVTDYPHDTIYENPGLYEAIGWNEPLYTLTATGWWFFMDENVNADTFTAIAETGYFNKDKSTLEDMINCARTLIRNDQTARLTLIFVLVLIMLVVFNAVTDKNRKEHIWEYLYCLCMTMGMIVLCTYLCYQQRLPLRAFHTITIPFIVVIVITLIRLKKYKVKEKTMVLKEAVMYVSAIAVIVIVAIMNLSEIHTLAEERYNKSQRTLMIEEYAIENPENFYVYDTSLTFRYLPFTVYTEKYPSNLMFWGGMGWNSPAFFKQLQLNGLDNLYSDVFFKDNVYYITWDDYVMNDCTMRERFMSYMELKFPGVKIEQVDSIGNNINVYKFSY